MFKLINVHNPLKWSSLISCVYQHHKMENNEAAIRGTFTSAEVALIQENFWHNKLISIVR